jgi:drug/metabolite transporter (DMT)-like permease
MKYNSKVIGSVCGILSAIAYGTNPLFGLPLYERGLTTSSVLFYRFLSSMIILFCYMLIRKESFRLERKQIIPMISGGLFMILACFFLYLSLHLLESGIALTLLFIYPLMVCAIMYLFFHVKQSRMTICGMILGTAGIILLSAGHSGGMISKTGLVYILLSALVYAVYMVMEVGQFLLLVRAILSWFPNTSTSKLSYFLYEITEPLIEPVRKMISKTSLGDSILDFSFLITFFILIIIQNVALSFMI